MHYNKQLSPGFTLAEIIISILLLSILALGTFETSHLAQHASNNSLQLFLNQQQSRQRIQLESLAKKYKTIVVDKRFSELACLANKEIQCSNHIKP